jgi:hypothetical protein
MENSSNISKSEYLKEAIFDLLNLIERANNSIIRHKSVENPDILAIQGFERIRQQYINELELKQFEFSPHIDDNTKYLFGA